MLIVGAGPTGLMLANQLARRGVHPILIDRHSGPAAQTRAMAVQARTLEIYSKLGVMDQALALGTIATGANLWANGRWTARIPLGEIGRDMSPFPYVLMLGQDDNEKILGEKLREHGVQVQWNTELVAFEQHPDRVAARIRLPDGTLRTMHAAWVAGCDGARSTVRETSGITFPGAPYEHVFFVADTEATGPMKAGELNVYLWNDGFHLFFPMKGKDGWRVIGILPAEMRNREDLKWEEVAHAVRKEAGAALSFHACHWFSTYRIHHRAAERFRDRRCFLLGDAAHIHSPAGAQGMNTGLQDAYNLGWKLAYVVRRRAEESLLDTYEQERIPVARRLLRTTDRMFQVIVADGWFGKLFRTRILARMAAFAMTQQPVRVLAFRTISQIGIRYPESGLSLSSSRGGKAGPAAGDRFPWLRLQLRENGPVEDLFQALDDTRFHLLVFGQPAAAAEFFEFGDQVHVHEIPAGGANARELGRVGITAPACYLLRPDGHIGLAGTNLDAASTKRYLIEHGFRFAAGAGNGAGTRQARV